MVGKEWLGVVGNAWRYGQGPVEAKYDETWDDLGEQWQVLRFLPSLESQFATMNLHLVTNVATSCSDIALRDPTREIQKGIL